MVVRLTGGNKSDVEGTNGHLAQAGFDVGAWCDMETIIDLSDVISPID